MNTDYLNAVFFIRRVQTASTKHGLRNNRKLGLLTFFNSNFTSIHFEMDGLLCYWRNIYVRQIRSLSDRFNSRGIRWRRFSTALSFQRVTRSLTQYKFWIKIVNIRQEEVSRCYRRDKFNWFEILCNWIPRASIIGDLFCISIFAAWTVVHRVSRATVNEKAISFYFFSFFPFHFKYAWSNLQSVTDNAFSR